MFDAHCHLDLCQGEPTLLLQRAAEAGVHDILIAGVQAENWAKQNALVSDGVHVAWGIHPWRVAELGRQWSEELLALESMLADPPVPPVALGETGLDYGKRIDPSTYDDQRSAFRAQIQLARKYALPIVLHIVRAQQDAIQILREEGPLPAGGLAHSFSGNSTQAQQLIDLNLHISFSGSVTNPQSKKMRKAATSVPDDRLLVETDSPDQTPMRQKPLPNEPAFLIDVIAALAELRGCSAVQLATLTSKNAHALFGTSSS